MNVVEVENLVHRYGDQEALRGVSFTVASGELFGIVGPNGGGKSTLFRILSTLLSPTSGSARLFGFDSTKNPAKVREKLGVVFQSPALDKKLTVEENMIAQGYLYGLSGKALKQKVAHLISRLGLSDRARDRVEKLSGGMQRRVEIAKGILHDPAILLMDEPTTGLDPGIRREVWDEVRRLQTELGVTVLVTTHLLEEAERCDRVAFLHQGRLVKIGRPMELKESVGGDVISVRGPSPESLAAEISKRFSVTPHLVEGEVRFEQALGHEFITKLIAAFPHEIASVTVGKPTLEDLFIRETGSKIESTQGAQNG